MKYDNITRAAFLRRPNRFIAEVVLKGVKETVHVKNTGRCRELLIPGADVWLTAPGTPGRKTKYDLVAVRKSNGILYNIDSQAPNMVVKEWLASQDYSCIIPEFTYGDSRIDFYMERDNHASAGIYTERGNNISPDFCMRQDYNVLPDLCQRRDNKSCSDAFMEHDGRPERYLMEVKGCTLEIGGVGYFPDAPTERGVKHIRELIKARGAGYHAALAFVIQMNGVKEVRPNIDMHPEFGIAMEEARSAGVEILFFTCHIEPDEITITACDKGTVLLSHD